MCSQDGIAETLTFPKCLSSSIFKLPFSLYFVVNKEESYEDYYFL